MDLYQEMIVKSLIILGNILLINKLVKWTEIVLIYNFGFCLVTSVRDYTKLIIVHTWIMRVRNHLCNTVWNSVFLTKKFSCI